MARMLNRSILKTTTACLLAAGSSAIAQPAERFNIGFNEFPSPTPPTLFTGGTEDGFQITTSGAALELVTINDGFFDGNVLQSQTAAAGNAFLTITRADAGDFEFARIASFTTSINPVNIRIRGFRDNALVGVLNISPNRPSINADPGINSAVIGSLLSERLDELEIRIPSSALANTRIDNIAVLPISDTTTQNKFWTMDAETTAVYEIDLDAETQNLISTASLGTNLSFPGGGAALNGSFYSSSGNLAQIQSGIFRLDLESGDLELIDATPPQTDNFEALTADPTRGVLYAVSGTTDSLYRIGSWTSEAIIEVGVLSANLSTDFGSAVGAAFDPETGTIYVATDDLPTDTIHIWSFDPDHVAQPGFIPTYVGDTGILSQANFLSVESAVTPGDFRAISQVGLAFDRDTGMLVMSSDEGPSCRFYMIDPSTAIPSFVFTTEDRDDLDTLSPADVGYTVRATPAGATSIPGAITIDQRTGAIFTATDTGQLAETFGPDLIANSFFDAAFPIGATDIEYADNADTTAGSAIFAISDTGRLNIVPVSGPPFSLTLASQGITTGTGVGITRNGEDLFFTSGFGQPGALYQFDPNTGTASLVTTQLEESPLSLEYNEATGLFYYAQTIDFTDMFTDLTLQVYDPQTDSSTLIDPALGTFTGNFAIDPEGQFALLAVDDRIDLIPLDTSAALSRVVFADNLPLNRSATHDMVFGPSSDGLGGTSLFVSANGRTDPAPPQILEFPFSPPASNPQNCLSPADLNTAAAASPASPDFGVPDDLISPTDFTAFVTFYSSGDLRADLNDAQSPNPSAPAFGTPDGLLTPTDFAAFAAYFAAGCLCDLPGCQ